MRKRAIAARLAGDWDVHGAPEILDEYPARLVSGVLDDLDSERADGKLGDLRNPGGYVRWRIKSELRMRQPAAGPARQNVSPEVNSK